MQTETNATTTHAQHRANYINHNAELFQFGDHETRQKIEAEATQYADGLMETTPKPPTPQRRTLAEIKAHNKRAGFYFFSRDTMRFFRSKIVSAAYQTPNGALFITRESFTTSDGQTTTTYKVREYNAQTGEVGTLKSFNGQQQREFYNVESAREWARAEVKARKN